MTHLRPSTVGPVGEERGRLRGAATPGARMATTPVRQPTLESEPSRGRYWERLALGLFALIACFALLGGRGLNEPDEGRYAEISREMLESGDWVMPTLHGFAHPQKPPVVYWLTAASFTVFGQNGWAARFPCALAAIGTAWLIFKTGRSLFGERAGVAATIVLVTSLQFFVQARLLTPDMILTFWITAAIASFVQWALEPAHRRWLWGCFIAMGLGFLTKGPMAIVVPVSAVATWQIALRRRGERVRIPWFRGMALTALIGISWFLIVAVREPTLVHFFAYDELVARFFTGQHGRSHSTFFYIPVLLVGLLPWTFLLASVVPWLNRELKTDQSFCRVWWLMIGWVVPPFLVLSLSGSKLITYVLPLYPALALAIGAWWERVGSRADLTWHAASIAGLFGSLIVALVAALRFTTHTIPAVPLPLLGVLILAALGMGALTVPVKPKAPVLGGGFAAASLGVWVLLLSQAASWNDLMGVGASMRCLAQRIRSETGDEPMVFVYGVNVPGLEWYLSRLIHVSEDRVDHLLPPTPAQQARLLSSPGQCSTLAPPGRPVFGVVKLTKVGSDWPTNAWRVVATAGSFALIQRMEGNP